MSNRFHSKNHRFNHHTTKTGSVPDAGFDPIASHESPFLGDFVQAPNGSVLSARDIRTNNILPFSGSFINFPAPYTVFISNLSALSATVNYQNILVTELSGFIVQGNDTSIHIHDIIIPGSNDLSISNAPISSNSWVSIYGDLQTQHDLYVSGVAYIANEFVTNLTATNLSAFNAKTYNLTSINNFFTNEDVTNSRIANLTATNLSAFNANIYTLSGVNNYFTNNYFTNEDVTNSRITNLTATNLSSFNVNTYNLTGINNFFTNEDVTNSRITNLTATNLSAFNANIYTLSGVNNFFTNVSISNCLSTNCISPFTTGTTISAHGNIDMLGYSISGIGNNSLSFQSGVKLSSVNNTLVLSGFSISESPTCEATGNYSHAEGYGTHANGAWGSHAEGAATFAIGEQSHAEGYGTYARLDASHAEGLYSTTSAIAAHAEGAGTHANGYGSHSEGNDTWAIGQYSHAEGSSNYAVGSASHAAGVNAYAKHDNSYVWSSFNTQVSSTTSQQFTVSAANGVVLGKNVEINGNLIFSNATTINSDVITLTSCNLFLSLMINNSSFALPLYRYN